MASVGNVDTALRIVEAQLAASRRSRREIPAGPLVGLLHDSPVWFRSMVLPARPGEPFDPDEIAPAVQKLWEAFAAEGKRLSVELVEEVSPGLADALVAAGVQVEDRPGLLAMDAMRFPDPAEMQHVTVRTVTDPAEHEHAARVLAEAYGSADLDADFPADPFDGGSVLLCWDGEPAAVAGWTPVAAGVAEIAGVGTRQTFRRRGLGMLATAHAVRAARDLAGVTLPWLTPGDSGADRIYRSLGFEQVGTAVHLTRMV